MKRKKKIRLIALALCLCVVVGMLPVTSMALETEQPACGHAECANLATCAQASPTPDNTGQEGETGGQAGEQGGPVTVSSFDALAPEIASQSYHSGELESEGGLSLPSALTGKEADGNAVSISGVAWACAAANAEVPVFDPKTPGEYLFRPALPTGYLAAEGTALPEINVVILPANETDSRTLARNAPTQPLANETPVTGDGYSFVVSTGVLTITSDAGTTNWRDDRNIGPEIGVNTPNDTVKSVVIQDGVTEIGESAFSSCSVLKTATLPDSVSSIKQSAFHSCSQLTSIRMPQNATLQSLGTFVFTGCASLTSIDLSGCTGLETIASFVFNGCTSLASVKLPNSLTAIEGSAFSGCTALKEVIFPASLQFLRDGAFNGCTSLSSLTFLGDTAPSVGNGTFSGLPETGKLTYPTGKNYDAVKAALPAGWSRTETVTGDGFSFVRSTGVLTITSNAGTTNWRTNENIATPVDYDNPNTNVTSVVVQSDVTEIGADAFLCCTGLQTVSLPATLTSIGKAAFEKSGLSGKLDLSNLTNLETIGVQAFWQCNSLTAVTLPSGLQTIGRSAFRECAGITSADLSRCTSLQTIEQGVFDGCSALIGVALPPNLTTIKREAFSYCSALNAMEFPAKLSSIGYSAFNVCRKLSKLSFYGSAPALEESVFANVSETGTLSYPKGKDYSTVIAALPTGWSQSKMISGDGYLFNPLDGGLTITNNAGTTNWRADREIGNEITEQAPNESVTSVVVQSGVTQINAEAFAYCEDLTSATLPEGVTILGDKAFLGCTALKGIVLPSSLESIKASTFQNAGLEGTLTIPVKVTEIGDYAYTGTSISGTLAIPASVKSIGVAAFMSTKLEGVDFSPYAPTGGAFLSPSAFSNNTNLRKLVFMQNPAPLISIGTFADAADSGTVHYPRNATGYDKTTFAGGELSGWTFQPELAVPTAPAGLTAEPGDGQVKLSWTAPDDGGSSVTKYQVSVSTTAADDWEDIPGSGASTTSHTVTGLSNGTEYTFKVRAVNALGNGAAASVQATPATTPAAPTGLTATPADGKVTLNWTAGDNGGSAIIKYQVSVSTTAADDWNDIPGSGAGTTSYIVTGLENGTEYTFKVRAVNAAGNGAAFGSVKATPFTTPAAPTGLTATPADGKVTLNWTTGNNGGSAITEYQYSVSTTSAGDWKDIPNSNAETTSYTVTGLENGTEYTFKVRAVNAKGNGTSASVRATPATTPAGPTGLKAAPADGKATLSWTTPDDGGSAIMKYQYSVSTTSAGDWKDIPNSDAETTSYTVTGLENGTEYTFKVRAVNGKGNGAAASVRATPATTPAGPTGLKAAPADGKATLSWTTPDDGGSAIMKYQYSVSTTSAGVWKDIPNSNAETTSYTVTGLENGTEYTFKVHAVNAKGNGTSASVRATPATTPAAPTGLTATPGKGQVTLSWTAGNNGGTPLTKYQVSVSTTAADNWKDIPSSGAETTSYTVTGLENGTEYTFKVRAVNVIGNGEAAGPVTATPDHAVYTLTVSGGTDLTDAGPYTAGTQVRIEAAAPQAGKVFDRWTGGDDSVFASGSRTSAATTITMPAGNLTLTATYRDEVPGPGPQYPQRTITGQNGVTVSGSIAADARLVVKEVTEHEPGTCASCDDIRARREKGELIALYDISIVGDYNPPIEVSLPVGSEYDGQQVLIIHYRGETWDERKVTVAGGVAKAWFDNFSPFAAAKLAGDPTPTTAPRTGDGKDAGLYLALAAIAGACVLGTVLLYRKRRGMKG